MKIYYSQLILPNTNITLSIHKYHIRMASTDKEWLDDNGSLQLNPHAIT